MFVYGTEGKSGELMSRKLKQFSFTALFIDGMHFGEHVVLRRQGSMSMVEACTPLA
jgi:hypothetical protein